jgi:hypothetical protein
VRSRTVQAGTTLPLNGVPDRLEAALTLGRVAYYRFVRSVRAFSGPLNAARIKILHRTLEKPKTFDQAFGLME